MRQQNSAPLHLRSRTQSASALSAIRQDCERWSCDDVRELYVQHLADLRLRAQLVPAAEWMNVRTSWAYTALYMLDDKSSQFGNNVYANVRCVENCAKHSRDIQKHIWMNAAATVALQQPTRWKHF